MSQRERSKIRKALRAKGFVKHEGGNHEIWAYDNAGIREPVVTILSRGSGYKKYGDRLLRDMRFQLKLDTTADLCDLIDCPMTAESYRSILMKKGILSDRDPSRTST